MNTIKDVVALLNWRHVPATLEYPDFINIAVNTTTSMNCGTANGVWECDVVTTKGDFLETVPTDILSDSTDVVRIAEAIIAVYLRRRQHPDLLDVLSRAHSVIVESDGADEHADLIAEMATLIEGLSKP